MLINVLKLLWNPGIWISAILQPLRSALHTLQLRWQQADAIWSRTYIHRTCDLQQIAPAIYSKSHMKSHTKSLVLPDPKGPVTRAISSAIWCPILWRMQNSFRHRIMRINTHVPCNLMCDFKCDFMCDLMSALWKLQQTQNRAWNHIGEFVKKN
jgi:hypothetical protein